MKVTVAGDRCARARKFGLDGSTSHRTAVNDAELNGLGVHQSPLLALLIGLLLCSNTWPLR